MPTRRSIQSRPKKLPLKVLEHTSLLTVRNKPLSLLKSCSRKVVIMLDARSHDVQTLCMVFLLDCATLRFPAHLLRTDFRLIFCQNVLSSSWFSFDAQTNARQFQRHQRRDLCVSHRQHGREDSVLDAIVGEGRVH